MVTQGKADPSYFVATADNDWNTSSAASFQCDDYDFVYNSSATSNTTNPAYFTIHNVQSEPLFGFPEKANQTDFDAVDNAANCPSAAGEPLLLPLPSRFHHAPRMLCDAAVQR